MPISALQIDGGLTQRDEFCFGDGTFGRKIIELGKRRAGGRGRLHAASDWNSAGPHSNLRGPLGWKDAVAS